MMSVEERRKGIWLWRDVLFALDPRACRDPYFNRRISLESRFSLGLVSVAERIVRRARIKQMAQGALFRAQALNGKLRKRGTHELRANVLTLLREQDLDVFAGDTAAVARTEVDPLGLERLQILLAYASTLADWPPMLPN
jgi:hypothetical protein